MVVGLVDGSPERSPGLLSPGALSSTGGICSSVRDEDIAWWENHSSDTTMMTSFSNPNYTLHDPDALNSNLPLTADFCDNDHVYGPGDPAAGGGLDDGSTARTNASSKRRKKYANLDPAGMVGVHTPDGSIMVHNDMSSPDSVTSPDDSAAASPADSDGRPSGMSGTPGAGGGGGGSAAGSPLEKTAGIVEVEHTESATDDDEPAAGPATSAAAAAADNEEEGGASTTSGADNGRRQSKGFLGFYASLEMSANARMLEGADSDEEEEEDERAPLRSASRGEGGQEDEEEEERRPTEKTPLIEAGREASSTSNTTTTNGSTTDTTMKPAAPKPFKNGRSYDDKAKDINSPDSNDSGIQADVQHVRGPANNDLYAVIDKAGRKPVPSRTTAKEAAESTKEDSDDDEKEPPLPPGWEKHEDEDGAYYWHIKSGTIQRDAPPPLPKRYRAAAKRSISSESNSQVRTEAAVGGPEPGLKLSPTPAASTAGLSATSPIAAPPAANGPRPEDAMPTMSAEPGLRAGSPEQEGEGEERQIRFAVRSLGWVRIAEEDLTPERSSKAVNKCIVNLSLGRNDINDVVGRWGDGKDLFMDLDSEHLTLIDPQDMTILNVQPIQSIRVWGVGRDNGRDFAYVARDRTTRKHMCHVFRCDTPARQIANTLRDICKRIMVERSLQHSSVGGAQAGLQKMSISRPNNLPDLNKDHNGQKLTFQNLYKNTSFPTPMEEPKKVLRCHYLGSMQVNRAAGIEVINAAMEKAYSRVPPEKWVFVSVGVAPSTITIIEHGTENVLAECRVRFLSFMGIAMRNVKMCAFIMHTAQDSFMCHIFHSEPSAGALCKTIEAACKLRYQKCLDAHPQTPSDGKKNQHGQQKQTVSDTLKAGTATLKAGVQSGTATLKAGVQNVIGFLKKKPEQQS